MAFPPIALFRTVMFMFMISTAATLLLLSTAASAYEFTVGGPVGWSVPPSEDPEFYNHWASRNRFHVGDSLNFLNEEDSVLVVSGIDKYMECNVTDPVQELVAGNTTFRFAWYGFYYFISGTVDHCVAGQRVIVRVMVQDPTSVSPSVAPRAPSPSDAAAAAAAPPGAYGGNVPASTPAYNLRPGTHQNAGSAVKGGSKYGSLSIIGALLLVGLI